MTTEEKILELLKDKSYKQILGTMSAVEREIDSKLKATTPLQNS